MTKKLNHSFFQQGGYLMVIWVVYLYEYRRAVPFAHRPVKLLVVENRFSG